MTSNSLYVMNWRNRTKIRLVEYKGGKCLKCGFDKPLPYAYDFHHRDPNEKDFTLGGQCKSFARLKEEADKCDLLCKICHAEVHFLQDQATRKERMQIQQEKREAVRKQKEEKKELRKKRNDIEISQFNVCEFCNIDFVGNSRRKFCSHKCAEMNRRQVERPSLEVLLEEVKNSSYAAVGRKYGVSDSAVKKWLKQILPCSTKVV